MAVALLENTEQQFGQALKVTRLDRKGSHGEPFGDAWPERDKWQSLRLVGQRSLLRQSYRKSSSFPGFFVRFFTIGAGIWRRCGNAGLPSPDLSHVENLESFCLRGVAEEQEPSCVQVE